jgi:hypothetical protein
VSYRVELRPAAVRDLRKLEPAIRRRIASAIDLPAHTPRPPGVEKLQGQENRYRPQGLEFASRSAPRGQPGVLRHHRRVTRRSTIYAMVRSDQAGKAGVELTELVV